MTAAAALKRKLASGEAVTVVNADHPSPSLVEALGRLPVDAVFIDCEQGSPDFESVEDMARAARAVGLASLVRVFGRDDWIIERFLFRGVDGLVVPRVDSAEAAKRVVDAVRYCRSGSDADTVLAVQVESVAAVRDLDRLLGVEGIDVFFVGPVDLAKSMGYGGVYARPEVQVEIDRVIAAVRGASRAAGMLVGREDVERYRRAGVQFLYVHANAFLTWGAETFASALRRAGT